MLLVTIICNELLIELIFCYYTCKKEQLRQRESERTREWESKRMMDIRTNEWVYSQSMILWFWLVGLDKLQGDKHTLEN